MARTNELGQWLEEFSTICSICNLPYKYSQAGDVGYSGGVHCQACILALGAIQGMVTAKTENEMDVGRGYYVRTMFEAAFVRIHKLSASVDSLLAKVAEMEKKA